MSEADLRSMAPQPIAAEGLALVDAAKMARTRLQTYADQANAGEAQAGGRELARKIWGAFAEFDALSLPGRTE